MKLTCDPPVPAAGSNSAFVQTIALTEGKTPLGTARWMATDEGVAQLLEIAVDPDQRRHGLGGRLVNAVAEQARAYYKSHRKKLRRLWMAVAQKSQVTGRAFLTDQGFHHIGTVGGLYTDQDLLVYVKSYD